MALIDKFVCVWLTISSCYVRLNHFDVNIDKEGRWLEDSVSPLGD